MTPFLAEIPWATHIQSIAVIIIGLASIVVLLRGLNVVGKHAKIPPLAMRPLSLIIRWAGLIVIIATVLSIYGYDLMTIITAVLAMVAIGFVAVWSVLSNVTCTFLLIVFRAFRVGDEIEFPGEPVKGRVVDLNFLFTTLKTDGGALYQIPNNLFFQKTLRRTIGNGTIDLGQQLNENTPAE